MNNVKYLLDEVLACFLVKKKKKGSFPHHIYECVAFKLQNTITSIFSECITKIKEYVLCCLVGCLFKNHCLLQFD